MTERVAKRQAFWVYMAVAFAGHFAWAFYRVGEVLTYAGFYQVFFVVADSWLTLAWAWARFSFFLLALLLVADLSTRGKP